MYKLRMFLKKITTPITIMFVPHTSKRAVSIKMPTVGIIFSALMCIVGTVYVFSIAVEAFEYESMKGKLSYYKGQLTELRSTITALKSAENQFRKLFSLKSKEEVLENLDSSDRGSLDDVEALKAQIRDTVETVGDIKDYLSQQKDLYLATPRGWPVIGRVTSSFGERIHPISGSPDFHQGLDVSAPPGAPVRATAEGIVSFAGWGSGNGNLVVIEHGFGYSSFYAHNKSIAVAVGQRVKRGDVIAYLGSTGNTTGPHLHYEVWKDGKALNPAAFIESASN